MMQIMWSMGTQNWAIHSIPDYEILVGEILAYRAWNLYDGLLESMYANHTWHPGKCPRAENFGPNFGQGFHAFKTLKEVKIQYPFAHVYGEVLLWGTIFEHELGYRAEFAKVNRILKVNSDIPFFRPRARALNRRYCGC